MHEEDEIGAERAVDHQFAAPMTVRVLLPEQIFLRASDRIRDLCILCRVSGLGIGKNSRQLD
jgi:hypothetical protein